MSPQQNHPTHAGIDIHEAMEILSARKATEQQGSSKKDGCACCSLPSNLPNENAKQWGQRIDLMPACVKEDGKKTLEWDKEKVEKERSERRAAIENRLQSSTPKDLLSCLLQTQQDRVTAYRDYDR